MNQLIQRLYGFSNLPVEFWPRLISRFINFSFGEESIWEGIDIDARREGIKMVWNDGTRLIIQERFQIKKVFGFSESETLTVSDNSK